MKTDFKKSLDSYPARREEIRLVEVPPLQYLMVDGHGDPNSAGEYADAVQVLYELAYALKYASKEDLGRTLHVGSFEDEGPVLADLHARFIPEHGLAMTGKHHEIYLSDPRRTAPDRLRTILRQPVQRR